MINFDPLIIIMVQHQHDFNTYFIKKDELFLKVIIFKLLIHYYSLSVSVLSLSSVAIISSIESGIVPRIVVPERYTSSFTLI